ncbi:MAG TPA: tetratricopeptide repeat protein [Gemmatimonadaceae bacterium]
MSLRRVPLALLAAVALAGAPSACAAQATAERPVPALRARVDSALRLDRRGERREAERLFDSALEEYRRRGARMSSAELTAVGIAARELGRLDHRLFRDALRLFDEAIAADSSNLEAQLLVGELFLDKYNGPDARAMLEGVLRREPRHARALVALARLARFDGAPGADSLVRRALDVNPNLVEARALLATLRLEAEDWDGAAEEAKRALAADSTSLDALGAAAATAYLRGDDAAYARVRRVAAAVAPGRGDIPAMLAEMAARQRQYARAVELAREAVRLDSTLWRAHGVLGINALRTGDVALARRSLETAFAGDPYDVWIKNTLDLLDTYGAYREVRTPRFVLVLDTAEAELLAPYLTELMESAFDSLARRYRWRPSQPVRLELYRRHADFSVRSVGLAGLGALGVSFGPVLAMDSPAAREIGAFNWGSTAWHELAHTFTLGMTEHRVPRWLSEGLSVLEERRARRGWGGDVSLDFLAALASGRLNPASRLNDGFVRPAYPAQVVHSYYQASLLCEFIERTYGWDAVLGMLREYGEGRDGEEVVRRVLRVEMPELDRRFDAWLRERFAGPLAALKLGRDGGLPDEATLAARAGDRGDFLAQLARGRALLAEGKAAEAVPWLERARELFPEYAGADAPDWLLAQAHASRSDWPAAAAALRRLVERNETSYEAHLALADALERTGDDAGAADALDRALWISPYEPAVHERLAELASRRGDRRTAVRERRAVLALDPVDRAEALYRLALAQREAGDATGARRTVLEALERAPDFARAQELLLGLSDGGRP